MNQELMLTYLSLNYFNQDYDEEGLPPIGIVRYFAETEDIQSVQIFYAELAEFLAGSVDEQQARVLWMDDAHAMYEPTKDGIGYLEWLRTMLVTVGEVLRLRWLTPRASLP